MVKTTSLASQNNQSQKQMMGMMGIVRDNVSIYYHVVVVDDMLRVVIYKLGSYSWNMTGIVRILSNQRTKLA